MSTSTSESPKPVDKADSQQSERKIEVLEAILRSSRQTLDAYSSHSGARVISSGSQTAAS